MGAESGVCHVQGSLREHQASGQNQCNSGHQPRDLLWLHAHTPEAHSHSWFGLFCIHLTYMVRWWTACSRGLLLYNFWDLGVQGWQPFKAVCSIQTTLAESQVQRLQRTQVSTEAVHTHTHIRRTAFRARHGPESYRSRTRRHCATLEPVQWVNPLPVHRGLGSNLKLRMLFFFWQGPHSQGSPITCQSYQCWRR